MSIQFDQSRYDSMIYRRCGRSGIELPVISLGGWHNFGAAGTGSAGHTEETAFHENCREIIFTAFNNGITHFDFANDYGPPPGATEERAGQILKELPREEILVSTKAGYKMWNGPYGNFGSRKYLLSSLYQSLKRLDMDYVDIFYHHRPDPVTPLEETLGALNYAVESGRALYAGVSNYPGALLEQAQKIVGERGWHHILIHQPSYSMLNRGIEQDLLPSAAKTGTGVICFSPLAQGLLTDKYIAGIPEDSRAASENGQLKEERITPELQEKLAGLNEIAVKRGQSLAQLALVWVLRNEEITSVLIGASRPEQIIENVKIVENLELSPVEIEEIENILSGKLAGSMQ